MPLGLIYGKPFQRVSESPVEGAASAAGRCLAERLRSPADSCRSSTVKRRYDVAHRQHDRHLCALAATLGALSGCLIPDGGPRDVPSTSSATSLESEREASGRSDSSLDESGLLDPA